MIFYIMFISIVVGITGLVLARSTNRAIELTGCVLFGIGSGVTLVLVVVSCSNVSNKEIVIQEAISITRVDNRATIAFYSDNIMLSSDKVLIYSSPDTNIIVKTVIEKNHFGKEVRRTTSLELREP